MIAGWLAPRIGFGQGWANAFFAAAYIAGGIFGVQAGLRSLRQWTIDVDLLMILAALGAAAVGAPFEGAMLLFLFSLSNVLQAYAIDRTRKAIHSLLKLRPDKALTRRDGKTVLLSDAGAMVIAIRMRMYEIGFRIVTPKSSALYRLQYVGTSAVDSRPKELTTKPGSGWRVGPTE